MAVDSSSNLRPRRERSRNGCLCCRRRRKKCDEQKPVCIACQRNKLSCIWPGEADDDDSFDPYTSSRGYREHTSTGRMDRRIEDLLDIFRAACAQSHPRQNDRESLREAEYQARPFNPDVTPRSRIYASPLTNMMLEDARSFPFVMSSLQAHSSLYKSHFNQRDSRRFIEIACQSRAAAIRHFRSTVSEVTDQNALGTLSFSAIQVVLCLEFPIALERHNLINIIDGAYELIVAIRGFFHIQPLTNPYITNSFRSAWRRSPRTSPSYPHQQPSFLWNLSYLFCAIQRLNFRSVEEKEICLTALAQLYTCFSQMTTTPIDWTVLSTWPILVSTEFTDLVREKRPMALVILAHWFVLVFQSSPHWLLHAWAERIVSGVSNFISSEWRALLKDLRKGRLSDPLDLGIDTATLGHAIHSRAPRHLQVPHLSINPLLEEFLLLDLD